MLLVVYGYTVLIHKCNTNCIIVWVAPCSKKPNYPDPFICYVYMMFINVNYTYMLLLLQLMKFSGSLLFGCTIYNDSVSAVSYDLL